MINQLEQLLNQIKGGLPEECARVIDQRDGSSQVAEILRRSIDPRETVDGQCAIWDNCARYYTVQGRFYEPLSIFTVMYAKLMDMQENRGERLHKGTPLVRISEIHSLMGHPLIAKRYLMLTLCEDAISSKGDIPIETTGSYFRAVWQHGISDGQFRRYASEAWNVSQKSGPAERFPEWALQELDQQWMTEYPSTTEASLYDANPAYVRWLLSKLGSGDGKALERLAHYLLSCIPGFRAQMRTRSNTTDYDVYCAIEGPMYDFRSGLSHYFLCECKDWERPVDVTTVQKFASVLRGAKCNFGIIFTKNGVSGSGGEKDASRELLKIKGQDLTIISLSENELARISAGDNFYALLRDSYERERLDLPVPRSKNPKKRKNNVRSRVPGP